MQPRKLSQTCLASTCTLALLLLLLVQTRASQARRELVCNWTRASDTSAKSPISGYGNQASLLRCAMFKALRVLDFPSRFLWNVNSLQIPHQVPAGFLGLAEGEVLMTYSN